MIRHFLYIFHRISGLVICLFLLMWFITGLVLIYYPFPDVTKEQKYEKMEAVPYDMSLPAVDSLLQKIPQGDKVKGITLKRFNGQTFFIVNTDKKEYTINADLSGGMQLVTFQAVEHAAKMWGTAAIIKVDTLCEKDIWIMYNRYEKELPIYKFYFDDEEKHQLYISSHSGEVQQFTSSSERFWAYIGSIPHKLYIPALRKNTETWINTVTVLAIIGLLAGISGIYVGIDACVRRYRKKKTLESPYRKKWYKWHHITGLVFGLFLISWSVSGVLSLKKTPQWITKTYNSIPKGIKGKQVGFDTYTLDYRKLIAQYPDLKRIEWSYFQGIPVYNTVIGNKEVSFDASQADVKQLYLEEGDIWRAMQKNHKDISFTISYITEYEDYYLPWKKDLALPVYKVSVADADNSLYYINPRNGEYKYLNDNRKTRKWLFNGLHYFHIKGLVDKPVLWTIVIWILAVGCIIISTTGVWIGFKYMVRKIKRLKKYLCR